MSALNRRANAEVRIWVSSPSSTDSRDVGYVNLRVEDAISGTVLVDTEIDAGQWWRLLQSAVQTHPAFVSRNLDRVGKRMENTQIALGRHKDEQAAKDAWIDGDARLPEGWENGADTTEFRATNAGWVVVLRRWGPA